MELHEIIQAVLLSLALVAGVVAVCLQVYINIKDAALAEVEQAVRKAIVDKPPVMVQIEMRGYKQ